MNKILPMIKKKDKPDDEAVLEDGTIGGLSYTVFKRGVIHVTDGKNTFKKDCDLFEDELKKLKLNDLEEKDIVRLPGSGDNCDLVFTCDGDDITLTLEKKSYPTIQKLRDILRKGKK